jgi:hypothetical protein
MFVTKLVTWASALGILLDGCGPDTTPDAFTFVDRSDAEVSTVVESDPVIITGINQPAPIQIAAGEYSIDGQPFTAADGSVENGQAVRVRLTSADGPGVTRSATLTIGGVSDGFDVTTVRDVDPPVARIVFPHLDETWVQHPEVVVRGVASDNVEVASVTVNGVEATSSDGFATWQARLELARGQAHEIDVTVMDIDGNVTHPADSITVHAHTFEFGRPCGEVSYDLANNRMFTSYPLTETSLTDGRIIPLLGGPGYEHYGAFPLYDDVEGRLYIIDSESALAEVDLTDGQTATIISPEGTDGVSVGFVAATALDQANRILYVYSYDLAAVVAISVVDGSRSIVASNEVGTGPELQYPMDLAFDGSRLFAATGFFEPVVMEVDLESGDRTVISGLGVGSGSDFQYIVGLAADGASSTLYVADISGDLLAVNPTDGTRTIVSPVTEGLPNGAVFEQDLSMQFVAGNGSVVVTECKHGHLFSIDPSDGSRSILTPPIRGEGPPLLDPVALALGQDGGSLITLNRKGGIGAGSGASNLISVDTTTGNRAIVSNAVVGSGLVIGDAFDVVEDGAHGRYLVTDTLLNAVIAIDPGTGERTVVSHDPSSGTGAELRYPLGIAIDAARNRAVVVDVSQMALIGVDLETGDRTIITQVGGAGSGDDFVVPVDVELDVANDRAFVTDQALNAVFSVDLSSGARAIVSSETLGDGEPMYWPTRLAFDSRHDRIVVMSLQSPIAHIDPDTGNRDYRALTGTRNFSSDGVAFDPESGVLYFSSQFPDIIVAYDYEADAAVIISQ